MIAKLSDMLQHVFSWVGMVAVAVLMLHVVIEVALRYVFNVTLPGTLEYVAYWWMILLVFGGLIVAQVGRDHIRATIVVDRLSHHDKRHFSMIEVVITILFLAALAVYGFEEATYQMRTGEFGGAAETPIWPMRFLVPLGCVVFLVRLVSELLQMFRKRPINTPETEMPETGVTL